jgi:peptidase M28-like protein
LLRIAAEHVRIAEADRGRSALWRRLGGSVAEHTSARLFEKQIRPYLRSSKLEPFNFTAHRPTNWSFAIGAPTEMISAMPTPFDARFPDGEVRAPLLLVADDSQWNAVRGKWAFVRATVQGSSARNSIRDGNLYKRAVEAGAAGLIFSLPMKPGRWRAVVPVDKAYALRDEAYPDKRRPVPCFCVDAQDGELLERAAAAAKVVSAQVSYESKVDREGASVVGYLPGKGQLDVVFFNHLDSFVSGANDDASGLATTVGLAHRLSRLPLEKRRADFFFVALSAHHDGAEGMRAFADQYPNIFYNATQAILIEHTDAQGGREAKAAGWPARLNDLRQAYLGGKGWPEVRAALPKLVKETGVMSITPPMVDACIGDLLAICDQTKSFCLIQAPPYYHTDHDTLDKISRAGLEASVDFHMRLLEVTGALATS